MRALEMALFIAGSATPAMADHANTYDGNPCQETMDVHVIDSLDHSPVASAIVIVDHVAVVTDARGHAMLERICTGNTRISVSHPAYESLTHSFVLGRRRELELELQPLIEDFVVETKQVKPTEMKSTTTLSEEVLEKKRGLSLSETLAEVPGVSQLRSGTGVAKPIVRGHYGRRVPILVDGIRHRAQDWGIDHAPEIEPGMAERITVVRGSAGARYGSDAIGGVLLLEPRGPLLQPNTTGELHAIGYSNGLGAGLLGRVQTTPESMPRLSLQFDGAIKKLSAPSTPDYPLDNTAESEWSGGITAFYRADSTTFKLSLRHFDAELGVCLCFRIDSAAEFKAQLAQRRPTGVELYRSDFDISRPYQAIAHDLALARAQTALGFGTLTATYALQFDDRREFDVVRQSVAGPQFSFQMWTHDADVVVEHHPIHLGDQLHLSGTAGVVAMLQSNRYTGLPLVPSHDAISAGVFSVERLWGHDWEVEAGLRYDYLSRQAAIGRGDFLRLVRSGQLGIDACGTGSSDTGPVNCASAFHTASISLGGLVRVTPTWTTKLELATTARPPNPDEQYLNGSAPSFPVLGLGKPDAGAETSNSVTATVSYAGLHLHGEASSYASYIDNYLAFTPAIGTDGQPVFDVLIRGTFPRFVTRSLDAVFYGADGYLATNPWRWLELGVQGAMVRARNAEDGAYLVFIPADRVRSYATTSHGAFIGLQNLTATIAGTAVARQTRYDPAADLAPPPAGYFQTEAALGTERRIDRYTVKMALQASNVLGARYREYTSLMRYFADQPGRQLMFRITVLYDAAFSSTK
ncbi:MAG: TonB-dependent receptor [Deltaproteobacteria bacterium]|nr:TonB-dependent receptor [Deltaproteobacteria bacterium]